MWKEERQIDRKNQMRARDAVIKKNLEFVYGRNKEDKLQDPDKVAYVRSEAQPKGFAKDEAIVGFTGDCEVFLPAYKCNVFIKGDNLAFPSFEHALHASKFLSLEDRNIIRAMEDIVEVKRFVNKHKNDASKIKSDWSEHGLEIAKKLLRDKFMRSKPLKFALMKTGHKKLIYQNEFNDQYWGMTPQGKGNNHLGVLLQQIRQEIDYGEDIDRWIQDHLLLLHKEDVRLIVNIDDPANDKVRRRIAEANAKAKALKELEKASKNSNNHNKQQQIDETKLSDAEAKALREMGDPNRIQIDSKSMVYFGSADFNHVVVLDSTASRIHAAVVVGSDRVAYTVDLGSSNGTFLINSATQEKTRLVPFTLTAIAPPSAVTITDTGDMHTSTIDGCLSFGLSDAKYQITIFTNGTELRQQELMDRLHQPASSNGHGTNEQNNENTVFVRNLDPTTTDEELREFFASCGEIAHVHIPRDRQTHLASRGIAFVTFVDSYPVYQALTLDGDQLKASYVKIKRSEAQGTSFHNNSTASTFANKYDDSNNKRSHNKDEIARNAMRMSGSANSTTTTSIRIANNSEPRVDNRDERHDRDGNHHRSDRGRSRSRSRHDRRTNRQDSRDRHSRRDRGSGYRGRDRDSRDDDRTRRNECSYSRRNRGRSSSSDIDDQHWKESSAARGYSYDRTSQSHRSRYSRDRRENRGRSENESSRRREGGNDSGSDREVVRGGIDRDVTGGKDYGRDDHHSNRNENRKSGSARQEDNEKKDTAVTLRREETRSVSRSPARKRVRSASTSSSPSDTD